MDIAATRTIVTFVDGKVANYMTFTEAGKKWGGHDDVEGYLTADDVIRYIRSSDTFSDWATSTAPIVQ